MPTDLKTVFVPLLFKKGNKASAENYCPISITSAVAKIQERVVNDSFMKHLKLSGILPPSQYGFQPGKSLETNLLETYDFITDLIEGLNVDVLLLYLAHLNKNLSHVELMQTLWAL